MTMSWHQLQHMTLDEIDKRIKDLTSVKRGEQTPAMADELRDLQHARGRIVGRRRYM